MYSLVTYRKTPWGLPEYPIMKKYVDPMKMIQEREYSKEI
jgi:hypothetical protein